MAEAPSSPAEPDDPAMGQTTRQPLADSSRKVLGTRTRTGYVFLGFAVLATGGAVAGLIAGQPGTLALIVVAVMLAWYAYSYTGEAREDLRVGTEDHYEGPWQQRVVTRTRKSDVVFIKLPTFDAPLRLERQSLASALRRRGVTDQWSPGSGQISYTSINQQALRFEYNQQALQTLKRPPSERELHGLLDGEREAVLAARRKQAEQAEQAQQTQQPPDPSEA
jgi:hypothetical protein